VKVASGDRLLSKDAVGYGGDSSMLRLHDIGEPENPSPILAEIALPADSGFAGAPLIALEGGRHYNYLFDRYDAYRRNLACGDDALSFVTGSVGLARIDYRAPP
jgi:hypothetical protein